VYSCTVSRLDNTSWLGCSGLGWPERTVLVIEIYQMETFSGLRYFFKCVPRIVLVSDHVVVRQGPQFDVIRSCWLSLFFIKVSFALYSILSVSDLKNYNGSWNFFSPPAWL
jgi:hypothetical protein